MTLIGANGAGKSTTLRSINGLNHPREGHDPLPGPATSRTPPPHEIVRIGHRPVAGGPPPLPAHVACSRTSRWARSSATDRASFKEDLDRVYHALPAPRRAEDAEGRDAVGRRAADGARSGRALMARPKLLMLDEPSMGLAPIFVEKIFEIVARDQRSRARRSCSSSRTRSWRSTSRSRGYVLETGTIALADDGEGAARERAGPQGLPRRGSASCEAPLRAGSRAGASR